ncbi:MAG: hypothetical protein Q7S40_04450 [Opitutaceae bacterium]|nr:hypothetical protein [Opitutaceae bacterium]
MKCFCSLLVAAIAFSGATALAMPQLQHRVDGIVQHFDPQTRILTVAPTKSELPSSFLIKEGRTRLRQDGIKATVEQLPATGPVRIYYKTELGQRVATEVSWRSEKPKP